MIEYLKVFGNYQGHQFITKKILQILRIMVLEIKIYQTVSFKNSAYFTRY